MVETGKDGGINQTIILPNKYIYKLSSSIFVKAGEVKVTVRDNDGNIINQAISQKNNSWDRLDTSIMVNPSTFNSNLKKSGNLLQVMGISSDNSSRQYKIEITGLADKNQFFVDGVSLSPMAGSGNSCVPDMPDEPRSCEFFERCASEFTQPTCEYNPNWRNELTDDQKLKLREAFGVYGLDSWIWSDDPRRLDLGNYISVKPLPPVQPDNWHIYRETVAKAVYATYPYLSETEREEIVNELENAWWRRQDEVLEYSMNGLLITMDIVTLPETLGSTNALRQGAWNLIKNPKQIGNFFVKLGKIPEAIESLRTSRSPAAIARLLEIDGIPVVGVRPPGQMDTLNLLRIRARPIKGGIGAGFAASVAELTPRVMNLANDTRAVIVRFGGRVDYNVPILIAKDTDEFIKLAGVPKATGYAAFYNRITRKIIVNPAYIRSAELSRFFTHETMHQVTTDAGIIQKITKHFGVYDARVDEAFTEYLSAKINGNRLLDIYKYQVEALRNFLYKYVYDYLDYNRLPRTPENILAVKNWLNDYLYKYAFTSSTELVDIYNNFYGANKFGEILRFFFQNVPQVYNPTTRNLAYEFKNILDLTLAKINRLIYPKDVYAAATRLNCCYDWPDEGELKKPFIGALETSDELGIDEWDTESFEALIKLEWLRNKLNENKSITASNFDELTDLDFKVEVEEADQPETLDTESLPLDTTDTPFTASSSYEPKDVLSPPDISTEKINDFEDIKEDSIPTTSIESDKPQIIIGDCTDPNAWTCEWPDRLWKNCLGIGVDKQGLFDRTYCNGELMWKYQAAQAYGGNGSECGGLQQNFKAAGCN